MPKRIEMPGFIKPQLATLKPKAPKGEQWVHEIKYDGYRIQVHLDRGRKKVFTRNGLDWTKRFSEIAGALAIAGEAISMARSSWSMEAGPTSQNFRPNSPPEGRAGWCITPSISCGVTGISESCRRLSASSDC